MKFILYLFLSLINCSIAYSQSEFVNLYSQEDIDNFKKKYGDPKIFNHYLTLKEVNGPIYNLDSLNNIEYIKELFIGKMDSLKSVDGLKNLKFVKRLTVSLTPHLENFTLPKIDTIDYLHILNFPPNNIFRLRPSLVGNINFIKYLLIKNNIAIEAIPNFSFDSNFKIEFSGLVNYDNIPLKTNRFQRVDYFDLRNSTNVISKGIMQLDTVGDLQFYNNKNCDFRIVELVKSINHFGYGYNSTGNSFGDGFKHIYSIDSIYLIENIELPPFRNIFPNPLLVKEYIRISDNINLTSIADYNNISISPDFNNKIIIRGNKQLNNCNVDFLCQALQFMPERIVIDSNGIGCTIEEVKKYCTVSTNPSSFSTPILYPNPSNSYVKIEGLDNKTYTYQLSYLDGRHIHNGTVPEDHIIDIHTLDQGVYILHVTSTDQTYKATRKIIKIE